METTHVFRFFKRDWTLYRRGTGNRQPTGDTPWSYRLTVGGKRVLVSTRTAHLATAIEAAKKRIESVSQGRIDVLDLGRAGSSSRKIPTFGDVKTVYLAAKVTRDNTANGNWLSLQKIARVVTGQGDVASMRIDILNDEFSARWLAHRQELPRPDYANVLPVNAGANSTLRQAKAVFAARHRHIWKDWVLPPGVASFASGRMLKEAGTRYVPIPEACLAKVDAAVEKIRGGPGPMRKRRTDGSSLGHWDGTEFWIVNRSIRLMGLRDSEVAAMKTGWLIEHGGRLHLDVVARPGEFVPKGHQGRVTVPSVLEPIFRKRIKEAGEKSVHLVRTENDTQRHDLIYRSHSQWLRSFLPAGRRKTNHELRKHAGSLVALKFNSWESAARFLRENLETAKNHYLELLQPVGLEVEDLTYDAGPRKRVTVAKRRGSESLKGR